MGEQLLKKHRVKVHVTMLDAWRSKDISGARAPGVLILALVVRYLELALNRRLPIEWTSLKGLSDGEVIAEAMKELIRGGVFKSQAMAEYVSRLFGVAISNIRASLKYHPTHITCPVTLFRATLKSTTDRFDLGGISVNPGDYFFLDDSSNGWDSICRKLRLQLVEADHYAMLSEPGLSTIAQHLHKISSLAA
jgi:thioesterase domain-containing protein